MSFVSNLANSIFGGGQQSAQQAGQAASAAADPFAANRAQYGQKLNSLMNGDMSSNLTSLPGYQFQLQQGEAAINSQGAASGNYGSPALSSKLIQFAEGTAQSSFNNYFDQLAMLSGASGANYGAAANSLVAGQSNGSGQQGNNLGSLFSGLNTNISGGGILGSLTNSIFGGGQQVAQDQLAATAVGLF